MQHVKVETYVFVCAVKQFVVTRVFFLLYTELKLQRKRGMFYTRCLNWMKCFGVVVSG